MAASGHWCERSQAWCGTPKSKSTSLSTCSACNYYRPCFSLETSVGASVEVGLQDDLVWISALRNQNRWAQVHLRPVLASQVGKVAFRSGNNGASNNADHSAERKLAALDPGFQT